MTTEQRTVSPSATDKSVGKKEEKKLMLVDSFANGISIGTANSAGMEGSHLTMHPDDVIPGRLQSRYLLKNGQPLVELERQLQKVSMRGELKSTTVVLGVSHDPFHPFDEKFATSMKFLELFERYTPGRLIIQTRSPLIVIGLPVLKQLKSSLTIVVGIETPLQDIVERYSPNLPSVEERFKTVRALRRFGLNVGIQVAPLLPYGDWRKDAGVFAMKLFAESDFVVVRSLAQLNQKGKIPQVVARRLASERQFFWLRQDTHVPLVSALQELNPNLLRHPAEEGLADPQMNLFEENGKAQMTSVA